MNIFQKAIDVVDAAVGDRVEGMFYDVIALNPDNFSKFKLIETKDDFKIYSEWAKYHIVLHKPTIFTQAYSMIQVTLLLSEAQKQLNLFHDAIQPLLVAAAAKLLAKHDLLEKLADTLRPNPGWNSAHLAATIGLVECFKTDTVAKLLDQADTNTGVTPLMAAAKAGSLESMKELLAQRVKLNKQDNNGDTVFHYIVRNNNQRIVQVFYIVDPQYVGNNLDITNKDGKTPFQLAVQSNKQECALRLLMAGANANNALRVAIEADNVDLVKMAIIVGADVNLLNNKVSPLQLAQNLNRPNKDKIKSILTRVGATLAGGPQPTSTPSSSADQQNAAGYPSSGDRVLCLDGGGIRGLVLIQLLQALEKSTGKRVKDCFEWISGTSIGGIIGLLLSQGMSSRSLLGLFFELKDVVFEGARAYDPTPIENTLKQYYGETTLLSQLPSPPRVFVTGVLSDRQPSELHLFRNYSLPDTYVSAVTHNKDDTLVLKPAPTPDEFYVWQAARSTSAAPTLYPAYERFLDGGLIANNPSVDTLTEIQQYNEALKRKGQTTQPIQVLVSLGTGIVPLHAVHSYNIYRPSGPIELFNVVAASMNLVELLVDQCTQANGRSVERSAAWCRSINAMYHRYNPKISSIDIDCKDDSKLVNMVFETQCHVYDSRDRITQLGRILTR